MEVRGTVDGLLLRSSFTALGDGTHELPVRAVLRRVLGRTTGESVTVRVEERLA